MELSRLLEITCPYCGHKKLEEMPEDACQFFMNAKIAINC
jgi:sarcosine oxidase delta subunit